MTFTDDEVATIRAALLRALEDQGGEYPDYDGGHGLEPDPGLPRSIFYFLVSAFAPPGCGLATALGVVPGRREGLLLVGLGLLGLAVAPLLTFRHRRSPISLTNAQPRTVG